MDSDSLCMEQRDMRALAPGAISHPQNQMWVKGFCDKHNDLYTETMQNWTHVLQKRLQLRDGFWQALASKNPQYWHLVKGGRGRSAQNIQDHVFH